MLEGIDVFMMGSPVIDATIDLYVTYKYQNNYLYRESVVIIC
jgi:hypothetical protein